MGISQYVPGALGRPAWSGGKQVGVKKPLKQRQIWAVRFFLDREGRMRDIINDTSARPVAANSSGGNASGALTMRPRWWYKPAAGL